MHPKMKDELTIYPSQIKELFQAVKVALSKIALFVSIFVFLVMILRSWPIFIAEASFKQSQNRSDELMQLQSFLQNVAIQRSDSDAITWMRSKKLLGKVVQELGLQMAVSDQSFFSSFFSKMGRNLAAECRIFVEDLETFKFGNVISYNEQPLLFYLKLVSSERFEVFNEKKQLLTQGVLGEKVELPALSFTLHKIPSSISFKKFYPLSVAPWDKSIEALQKTLIVKTSKWDKSLICLSYFGNSRHLSAELVNSVMAQFQHYLACEHEEMANAQLAYLEKRESQLSEEFDKALQTHARYLAENLEKNGFMGIEQELQMIAIPKESYTSKLFELDLELKKWQHLESARFGLQSGQAVHLEAQFAGIDLERLQTVYAQYSQERDALQSEMDQLNYIQKQISSSNFELSSLSNLLKDPVSVEMVAKASRLSLELHDEQNRMPREQERLKEDLLTQKRFLKDHLAQTTQLFKIKLRQLDEKMAFLQNKAILLIKNEKKLIQDKLSDLYHQMRDFPEKWHLESQLNLKKEMMMKIIEGMTKLTESKVVHHHLFQVESKPLDLATPPLLPKFPGLFFLSLLSGLFASGIYFCIQFLKQMIRGFPICKEWLHDQQLHFSGKMRPFFSLFINEMKKSDLETVRNCAGFISLNKKRVVPVMGTLHFTKVLAELLSMQRLKTLVVESTFQASKEPTGLLQYLMTENGALSPIQKNGYDYLPSGGYSSFGVELLNSPLFSSMIDQLKKEYDCILIASSAKSNSLEVECLMSHADGVIVLLNQETPHEVKQFIEWEKKRKESALTFVKL